MSPPKNIITITDLCDLNTPDGAVAALNVVAQGIQEVDASKLTQLKANRGVKAALAGGFGESLNGSAIDLSVYRDGGEFGKVAPIHGIQDLLSAPVEIQGSNGFNTRKNILTNKVFVFYGERQMLPVLFDRVNTINQSGEEFTISGVNNGNNVTYKFNSNVLHNHG